MATAAIDTVSTCCCLGPVRVNRAGSWLDDQTWASTIASDSSGGTRWQAGLPAYGRNYYHALPPEFSLLGIAVCLQSGGCTQSLIL